METLALPYLVPASESRLGVTAARSALSAAHGRTAASPSTPSVSFPSVSQRRFAASRVGCRRSRIACRAVQAPWQEVVDASSGKVYFWNTATNETRWDAPPAAAAQAPAAAGPSAAAPSPAAAARKSNEELCAIFFDYLLTPNAKFDYPSPTSAFIDLVEDNREAIFEGKGCFYDYLNDEIDACDPKAMMDPDWTAKAIFAAEAGEAEATAASARQSEAAAGIAMWKKENMKWNSSVGLLTKKEALESIRSRLSNPVLRDANPAF